MFQILYWILICIFRSVSSDNISGFWFFGVFGLPVQVRLIRLLVVFRNTIQGPFGQVWVGFGYVFATFDVTGVSRVAGDAVRKLASLLRSFSWNFVNDGDVSRLWFGQTHTSTLQESRLSCIRFDFQHQLVYQEELADWSGWWDLKWTHWLI